MKDKSFVLRSSRITSKTYSTITPTFIQSLSPNHSPNDYYSSIQSSLNTSSQQQLQQQLSQKDKQLKQRLNQLNNNLKHMEKQYKQNLKQGFQNKIKSYRLQAVMERKMLKQTIDQTLKLNQLQEMKQKYQIAVRRKQFSQFKALKNNQMRQKQLQILKDKTLQQKRKNNHQISSKIKELQHKNKSLHDRIISQQKYKDRKRDYLEYWKQQKLKKDEFQQKKQFLQKIVMNTRRIKGLKQQLQNVEARCQKLIQKKDDLWKDRSTLFVTI